MIAVLVIAALIAATIVVAGLGLAPRMTPRHVLFDDAPDFPRAFGCDMCWLAIRSVDTVAVADALGVVDPRPANWNSGLGAIYDANLGDRRVFVSPPVKGWTFVAGVSLPLPASRSFVDKLTPMLAGLGAQFPVVQYFASFPIIDLYAWARADKGRLVRAFAIGDEGVVWDRGRLTPEERALGLKLFELRGIHGRRGDAGGEILLHPTVAQVFRVAHGWGLSPDQLAAASAGRATGLIAMTPPAWRVERARKAA